MRVERGYRDQPRRIATHKNCYCKFAATPLTRSYSDLSCVPSPLIPVTIKQYLPLQIPLPHPILQTILRHRCCA